MFVCTTERIEKMVKERKMAENVLVLGNRMFMLSETFKLACKSIV